MKKFQLDTENLAVPEVHSEKAQEDKTDKTGKEQESSKSVDYDNLAFPEIHIKKKK